MSFESNDEQNVGSTSSVPSLLTPVQLGSLTLPNRIVMSPMTRARSINGVPARIEAEYYSQRATAGLIVTGGIYISRMAIGAVNVPGIFTEEQIEAWKQITTSVHSAGGRIFAQLSHSGSVSHPSLLNDDIPVAPSAVNPHQKVMGVGGYLDTVKPRALTVAEIHSIIEEYRVAATNAKRADFDGIEIHGGNVYLIPEFLNPSTNLRQDEYGGSPENRARIVREVLTAIGTVWDHDRIGLKLSPAISGIGTYRAVDHILEWLNDFAPAYLHLRRGFDTNGNPIEMLREHTFDHFGDLFKGTLIGNGGFDLLTADAHVQRGNVDLVSFARHFIANPDLVARLRKGDALSPSDPATYYTGGSKGYIDYPISTGVSPVGAAH
ncbi:MAG: alkene reductase [Edaphobacter sp.]